MFSPEFPQDAKKDESVRKSYKYLAALHEVRLNLLSSVCKTRPHMLAGLIPCPPPQNCNQLIQTIEDTGTILREIRDLEEQVTLQQHSLFPPKTQEILETINNQWDYFPPKPYI